MFFRNILDASLDASHNATGASAATIEKYLEYITKFNEAHPGTIFAYPCMRQAIVTRMQQVFASPLLREAMGFYYEIEPDGTLTTELLNKINTTINRTLFSDEVLEKLGHIPEEFICPITLTIMHKPVKVITKIGSKEYTHYFEESAVEKCIIHHGRVNPMNIQEIIRMEGGDDLKGRILDFIKLAAQNGPSHSSSSSSSSSAVKR